MTKASDIKTFTKVESHLRSMTDAFLELGIAEIKDAWYRNYEKHENHAEAYKAYRKEYLALTSDTFVRSYLRAVAKELGRPFIVATVRPNYVSLVIPRKKSLEPVFANFLLLPEKTNTHRRDVDETYIVAQSTVLNVIMQGTAGRELYDAFLDRCRNVPDYKRALRTHDA